jgi:hypothetical protein
MMKVFQIGFGVIIVALGIMMLVVILRGDPNATGGNSSQAIIGSLSLIGVGAVAISAARKRKK